MALSIAHPSLRDRFAAPRAELQGGRLVIERVLTADRRRALLWGRQTGLDLPLLIERVSGLRAPDLEEAVSRRAVALALNNLSLARCVEVFAEQGALYTVQVTGAGTTLDQRAPISAAQAADVGIQLCNALNYLNRCQDCPGHGTVNPASVFITAHGRVKLTNIAALIGIADAASHYASALCENGRAEVFSVGATLHHALTGWHKPYRKGAPAAMSLAANVGPELSAVLTQALAADPALRYASPAALRFALLRLQ